MNYLIVGIIALLLLVWFVRPALRTLELLLFDVEKDMLVDREKKIGEQFAEINAMFRKSLDKVRSKLGMSDL